MKLPLIATLLALLSTAALAGPTCNAPREQWIKEADFKKSVEDQGYRIKVFKVTKGQCYEIYGFDKAGKKVEIYFDPRTGQALETHR